MTFIRRLWVWLDGKKTIIASIYWGAVMPSLLVIYPAGVPILVNRWTTVAGLFLSAIGLGHKCYKAICTPIDEVGVQ